MEKRGNQDHDLQRSDIDAIIKVNERAIELQIEVSSQFEEIISLVKDSTSDQGRTLEKVEHFEEKLEEELKTLRADIKEIERSQLKISLLLASGVISLIAQIVIAFISRK